MLQLREYGWRARLEVKTISSPSKKKKTECLKQTLIIVRLDKISLKDGSCRLIINQALFILEAVTSFSWERRLMILYLVYSLTFSQPPFQVIIPYSCVLTWRASEKYPNHGRRPCIIMVAPGCAGWMCKKVTAPMLGKQQKSSIPKWEGCH